jgi:hypothetical protein
MEAGSLTEEKIEELTQQAIVDSFWFNAYLQEQVLNQEKENISQQAA